MPTESMSGRTVSVVVVQTYQRVTVPCTVSIQAEPMLPLFASYSCIIIDLVSLPSILIELNTFIQKTNKSVTLDT